MARLLSQIVQETLLWCSDKRIHSYLARINTNQARLKKNLRNKQFGLKLLHQFVMVHERWRQLDCHGVSEQTFRAIASQFSFAVITGRVWVGDKLQRFQLFRCDMQDNKQTEKFST